MSKATKWRKKGKKRTIKVLAQLNSNNINIVGKQPKNTKGVVKWLNEQLSVT